MSVIKDLVVVRAIIFLDSLSWKELGGDAGHDFLEYLQDSFQYPQQEDLKTKVKHIFENTLQGSIQAGTDDFEIRYLNQTDGYIGNYRIITYLSQEMSGLKSKLQELFDPSYIKDAELSHALEIAYWSIRSTVSGCVSTKQATREIIKSAIHTCVDEISDLNDECPFLPLYESIQKAHLSALLIQRTWRRSIADPSMALCRKRIEQDLQLDK